MQWTQALQFIDDTLYSGTLAHGIMRSSDGGNSWSEMNVGVPRKVIDKDTSLPAIRALMREGNNIFAGTFGFGLIQTEDGGRRWTKVTTLKAENIICLTNDNGDLWAGTNKGIFRSLDNGTTWTSMNNGLPDDAIYGIVKSDNSYFAATYQRGVYRSNDKGETWTAINDGLPILQIWSIEAVGSTVYAGTHGSGVYRLTAPETTWTYIEEIGRADVRAFVYDEPNLFVGTYSGIWKTSDHGASWVTVGLPRTVISSLTFNGSSLIAGIFAGGASRSDNGGETWESINSGVMRSGTIIQCLLTKGGSVLAGIYGAEGVYRTDDNGLTWKAANNGLPASTVWSLSNYGSSILAGTTEGIYLTADNGENWYLLSDGLQDQRILSIASNKSQLDNFQVILAGTMNGVLVSSDGGATWQPSAKEIETKQIGALEFNGNVALAGVINGKGGIYRSTDKGKSWQSTGDFDNILGTCFAIKGTAAFAGTNQGVFYTTDYGNSWEKTNDGLTFTEINALTIKGSRLFAGTIGGSVFSKDVGTTEVSETLAINNELSIVSGFDGLTLLFNKPTISNNSFTLTDILGRTIYKCNIPPDLNSYTIGIFNSGFYICNISSTISNISIPIAIYR